MVGTFKESTIFNFGSCEAIKYDILISFSCFVFPFFNPKNMYVVLVFLILYLFDSIRNTVTSFSKNVNVKVEHRLFVCFQKPGYLM